MAGGDSVCTTKGDDQEDDDNEVDNDEETTKTSRVTKYVIVARSM